MADEQNNDQVNFKYNPGSDSSDSDKAVSIDQPLITDNPKEDVDKPIFKWSAPDSFSVNKQFSWYLALIVITLGVAAGIYLLTKDKITTAVILVSGILIGVYASKKPKMVDYQLTKHGFTINGRYHQFGEYRSFSVIYHGDIRSAVLTPLKRFMPYMYIYFASDMEQKILPTLVDVLPKETSHKDTLDNLLRKIGF